MLKTFIFIKRHRPEKSPEVGFGSLAQCVTFKCIAIIINPLKGIFNICVIESILFIYFYSLTYSLMGFVVLGSILVIEDRAVDE